MPLIEGVGTPEEAWRRWRSEWELPALALMAAPARVVVVAPHPDDEVLGVGGALRLLAEAGRTVTVAAVTDGEASHPGSPTLYPCELSKRRAAERAAALHVLGVPAVAVQRFGIPDGAVEVHEHKLTRLLAALLGPDSWCLAPWRGDGHPDHEAAGRAAVRAATERDARLMEYPVWMWHWARPQDPRVPWPRARRISLPPEVVAAKRAAVAEFATQVRSLSEHPADAAILPPTTMERLLRTEEVVFT